MKCEIIATGSKGNAVIINDEILIDCGVTYKKLEPCIKKLKLVLLTHVHGDHFKPPTVRALHQERPALRFGCCEWMVGPLLEAGVHKTAIHLYEMDSHHFYSFQDELTFSIRPVALIHDVPNCGYVICKGREKAFYATDTGTLDGIEAKGYDLYLIESNHTQAEIEARAAEKLAHGEFSYERRAAACHLSHEQAMDFLVRNAGPQSRYVLLHGHREKEENDGTSD